ncbi:MAG: hypothetical protein GY861_12510 [bacterium]|nr:hypothetical protein [bacterium]
MPSEILIPVRRRHATSRPNLEAIVTRAQHWGYAENEDLILIRRSNTARRYFSRSALMVPSSVFTPTLNCAAAEITLNYQSADVDIVLRSDLRNDQFWMRGSDGVSAFGKTTPETWDTTDHAVVEIGSQGFLASEFAGNQAFFLGNNAYYDVNDGRWEYMTNDEVSLFGIEEGQFRFWAADNAAPGTLITWMELISADITGFIFNNDGNDLDFRVEGQNDPNVFFMDASTDRCGMGTNAPLLNLALDGNFNPDGGGLHIKYYTANRNMNLVIEGDEDESATVGFAAGVFLIDVNAAANRKTIYWWCENELSGFTRLDDDGDNTTGTLLLTFDLVTGCVGLGSIAAPTLNGNHVLYFADNTADPTMGLNTAGFYGKDVAGTVEAFAVDEAGNAAQLTPHNEKGEWISNTYMRKGKKRIWKKYQMETLMNKLIDLLDKNNVNTSGLYEETEELI